METQSYKKLGGCVHPIDVRNKSLDVVGPMGINIEKYFMPSVANIIDTDLSNYKIVGKNQFACNLMHVGRDERLPISLHSGDTKIIVSPAYFVFEINPDVQLLPEFLMLWFRRPEFDRNAWFYTDGDVRGGLEKESLFNMEIPVPDIAVQRKIVAEYQAVEARIAANERMISKLEETAQAIYKKMFIDDIDPAHLPAGWEFTTLENLSEFIAAGTIPNYVEFGSEFVLGQKCNNNHKINLEKAKRHIPKPSCTYVKYGDVLINSTGEGTLGRVAQINFEPKKLTYDSNMTLVRPKEDYLIDYVYAFLSTKEDYFVGISQGSTNQTRLYCSMIRPLRVIKPANDVLIDYQNKMKPINAQRMLMERELPLLKEMLSLLESKMFQF